MRFVPRSLYARVALLYLLLLSGFSVLAVGVVAKEFDGFMEELEQRLNYDLAKHLAAEMLPQLESGFSTPRAMDSVKRLRSINPAVDIYILDDRGSVVAAYAGEQPPVRSAVSPAPIRKFLGAHPMLPIRAADPASAAGTKIFSAAPIALPGFEGYVFIILRGQPLETAASMLRNSYIIRGTSLVLASVLVCTVIAGLLAFSLLTRRFRRLTTAVRRFQSGACEQIPTGADDEIGQLGQAINAMVATIDGQLRALRGMDVERRAMIRQVSHDLRTPLTSLRGHAERLADETLALDQAAGRSSVAVVSRNVDQLEQLADRLASLASFDDEARPEMEPFSLAELTQDIVVSLRPVAAARAVTLESRFTADVPFVVGDIRLLEHAINLLLESVLRQATAGGKITVELAPVVDGVRVALELPTVTTRAPDEFGGVSGNWSAAESGLATARRILEKHHARLEIPARSEGTTCFAFTLSRDSRRRRERAPRGQGGDASAPP